MAARAEAPDESFDIVIMNPPFTRATNHEGAHQDVTNPAFAAFEATAADQTDMGNKLKRIGRRTCSNGNAGLASSFAALGHKKLKPNGILALVLPLTAAAGGSWSSFREMIFNSYSVVSILSIGTKEKGVAFSSDTAIAELLLIARKADNGNPDTVRPVFTSFVERPIHLNDAATVGSQVARQVQVRSIDDGPYGGTSLILGNYVVGSMMSAPLRPSGEP